jgi:DNA primase
MIKYDQEKIWRIYFETAQVYNDVFNSEDGLDGRKYLAQRGFSQSFCNEFMIGFSPYNCNNTFLFDKLVNDLKIDPIEILIGELAKIDIKNNLIKDYFPSPRVIFPIFEDGKCITFSGRSIFPNARLKYKTLVYNKIGVFNATVLKTGISKVYVCEGVIDTLSMLNLGLPAIGILGLNVFGIENLNIFSSSEYNKECQIVLAFDTDDNESGKRGRYKIANLLFNNGLTNLAYIELPKNNVDKKIDINNFMLEYGKTAKNKILNLPHINIESSYLKVKDSSGTTKSHLFDSDKYEIENIISKYVELINDSPNRKRCICPFPGHKDTAPSFVIYCDTNSYYCFGCGKSGDSISFISNLFNISYKEAAAKISNI